MRPSNANFDTAIALNAKNLVVAVEIEDATTIFVSGIFADFDSPPMGFTFSKLVKDLQFEQPEIDTLRSQYSPTTYSITIRDQAAVFTAFLSGFNILNKPVTIKVGEAALAYADFIELNAGASYVDGIEIDEDLLDYTLTVRDTLFGLLQAETGDDSVYRVTGFMPMTLNATLNSAELSTIVLQNTTTFYAEQADFTNNADDRAKVVVLIDDEIISYETTSTVLLQTLARPLGRTNNGSHNFSYAYPGIGFFSDPCRIACSILTTSDGTNGPYDVGFNVANLYRHFRTTTPVSSAVIDLDGITRLGYKYFLEDEYVNGHYFHFSFTTQVNEETFVILDEIVNELLYPNGMYIYVNGGRIRVGVNDLLDFIENFSAAGTLSDSNIENIVGFQLQDYSEIGQYIRNVGHNKNHGTPAELTEALNPTQALPKSGGVRIPIDLTNRGAYIANSSWVYQYTWAYNMRFGMLREASLIITLGCNFTTILFEPGDQVNVTIANAPNILDAGRGLSTFKGLITGQTFSLNNKQITHRVRLIETPGWYKAQAGGSYYTVNKIAEGDIDDSALDVSADETTTTEAADAYYDNSGTMHEAHVIMFRIRITPPAYGPGDDFETIELKLSAMTSAPAFMYFDYRRYIAFNPQLSDAFTIDLYLYDDGANGSLASVPDRVKVDWLSTTADANEKPTVELIGVWFIEISI